MLLRACLLLPSALSQAAMSSVRRGSLCSRDGRSTLQGEVRLQPCRCVRASGWDCIRTLMLILSCCGYWRNGFFLMQNYDFFMNYTTLLYIVAKLFCGCSANCCLMTRKDDGTAIFLRRQWCDSRFFATFASRGSMLKSQSVALCWRIAVAWQLCGSLVALLL